MDEDSRRGRSYRSISRRWLLFAATVRMDVSVICEQLLHFSCRESQQEYHHETCSIDSRGGYVRASGVYSSWRRR